MGQYFPEFQSPNYSARDFAGGHGPALLDVHGLQSIALRNRQEQRAQEQAAADALMAQQHFASQDAARRANAAAYQQQVENDAQRIADARQRAQVTDFMDMAKIQDQQARAAAFRNAGYQVTQADAYAGKPHVNRAYGNPSHAIATSAPSMPWQEAERPIQGGSALADGVENAIRTGTVNMQAPENRPPTTPGQVPRPMPRMPDNGAWEPAADQRVQPAEAQTGEYVGTEYTVTDPRTGVAHTFGGASERNAELAKKRADQDAVVQSLMNLDTRAIGSLGPYINKARHLAGAGASLSQVIAVAQNMHNEDQQTARSRILASRTGEARDRSGDTAGVRAEQAIAKGTGYEEEGKKINYSRRQIAEMENAIASGDATAALGVISQYLHDTNGALTQSDYNVQIVSQSGVKDRMENWLKRQADGQIIGMDIAEKYLHALKGRLGVHEKAYVATYVPKILGLYGSSKSSDVAAQRDERVRDAFRAAGLGEIDDDQLEAVKAQYARQSKNPLVDAAAAAKGAGGRKGSGNAVSVEDLMEEARKP
jgi:hypothetical protein